MKALLLASFLVFSSLAAQDVVVYGSTPGGIACAVRAAREGVDVLLVTHAQHAGGLLSSGLSTMDALYSGKRAPIYDELCAAIHEHYRTTYGKDSPQYRASLPGKAKPKYEAHAVEKLLDEMLAREPRITLKKGWHPVSAQREGATIRSATFRKMDGEETFTASARVFADCSYEADLAKAAGVPYRVGRESREEFGEEHAGVLFMRSVKWPPAKVDPAYLAEYRKLNLVHYNRWFEIIRPASTGAADPAVQAYNMRTVLTDDPANRVPMQKPANYDRAALVKRLETDVKWSAGIPGSVLPNRKTYWNLPELIGSQTAYVEGDWAERRRVTREHVEFTLALMYFLQTDESIRPDLRAQWREWSLPKDEFADNGHMPHEIYMRETRRITGRAIFTEHDARPAEGLKRAPVHADSIGITDWFLDSHACTRRKVEDSHWEGELLLNNITTPGQVSWRCLLPDGIDNLLVPVCLSSSHIGWGAIRLEPAWMSYGESAAHAIVIAQRRNIAPAALDADALVRHLAASGILLAFFNDVKDSEHKPWYPAMQYLGTQGFFGSYDVLPGKPLRLPLAKVWAKHTTAMLQKHSRDANTAARECWKAEQQSGERITALAFAQMLDQACETDRFTKQLASLEIAPDASIHRANACRLIFAATAPKPRITLVTVGGEPMDRRSKTGCTGGDHALGDERE
jgi:hypothetical protein